MKKTAYIYIICAVLTLITGCTNGNKSKTSQRMPRSSDTLYTVARALAIYDYQPEQALRIIDSAVVVGNVSRLQGDYLRAKIYAWTVMGAEVDSLLHGPQNVRFDSARVVCERLLDIDSVKANLKTQQDILELLVYTARMQQDMTLWMQRSQELVDVCHAQGAETEALRTEAEVGAALYRQGRQEEGLAKIDSVIALLDIQENRHFNELDALVIALKRKIAMFNEAGKYIETIPLARSIIDHLDDYAKHPDRYHDGTYREPADSTSRADYIEFYRTQAQSAITAAYAFLGEQGSMNGAYAQIERSVREATAREHIARYHALEQQMRRGEAENRSRQMTLIATVSVIGIGVICLFAAYIYFQSRRIRQKNRALVKLMKDLQPASGPSSSAAAAPSVTLNPSLFQEIDACIRTERLYADTNFQRQAICDRFDVRRETLNQLISEHTKAPSFPTYINSIRLDEACQLLREQPDKTVNAIAEEVGLSPRSLRRLFVEQYGMTPTEYRQGLLDS